MADALQTPNGKRPPLFQLQARQTAEDLLDRVAWIAWILGALPAVISLFRIRFLGWHPDVLIHGTTYVLVLIVLLLRRKIGPRATLFLLIGLVWLSALASYFALGLLSIGSVLLAGCCVVAGAFLGIRVGLALLGASLAGMLAIGGLIWLGVLAVPGDMDSYARSPSAWLFHVSGLGLFTVVMLAAVHHFTSRLSESMGKLVEQANELNQREQKYRLLAENMDDVLFVQDMELNLVYTSPSVERVFGYNPEEATRIKLQDVTTPESLQRAWEAFNHHAQRAQAGETSVPLMEFEYIRKDGSTFPGELRASFLFDEQGRISGTQGILRDISDRKRAEAERQHMGEQVRQSEKLQAIGEMAGGVAHDFNNHLSGILGFADLIRQTCDPDDPIHTYASNIIASAQRSADLTNKLLAFARKAQIHLQTVDLHAMIDEVCTILEHTIDKNIRIEQRPMAVRATVLGDPSQLQSALLNLGLNARDAMPTGGTLRFETEIVDSRDDSTTAEDGPPGEHRWLRLIVSDTGLGMTREVAERVFEPFFTTKEPGKGTGMGLSATYGTIQAHDGSISVYSQPGQGARFEIRLPLVAADAVSARERVVDNPKRHAGHVLLIDDEEMVRLATQRMLEQLGFRVTAVGDGAKGIEAFESNVDGFDLVMLDMILPNLGGIEVFERLRQILPDVKVLLFSGFSPDGEAGRLLAQGAAGFLPKPFTLADLSRVLDQALGSGHRRDLHFA